MRKAANGCRGWLHQGPFSQCHGFTLIECLLSLVMGVALFGVLCSFVGTFSKKRVDSIDFLQREQVSRLIVHAIRMADFAGCRRPAGWKPSFSNSGNARILSVWRASSQNAVVREAQRDASLLMTDRGVIFENGDAVIVTDCLQVATGRVLQVIPQKGGTQKLVLERPLTSVFSGGASVFPYGEEKYFVARDGRSGHQVLYLMNRRGQKIPLLKGVRQWQIHYDRQDNRVRAVSLELAPRWHIHASPRNTEIR